MNDALARRLRAVGSRSTLNLTHYGRKSGKPYKVIIWFVTDGDRVLLGTASIKRQWVKNVTAKPAVELEIGSEHFSGTARRITDEAERSKVLGLVARKYWYAVPFFATGALLARIGLIADNTGAFEVTLA